MFTSLISAVEIADIIVFVVLGLGLLGGLIGGLAKAFKGIFATMSIILISLLLVGLTVVPISSSSIGDSLSGTLQGKIEGWGTVFTSDVYIVEADGQPVMDGDNYTYCIKGEDGQLVMLSEAAGSGLVDKAKGKIAVKLAQRFITPENSGTVSLAGYASDAVTTLIFDVALFIAYCIVLGVVFYLLRKLFTKLKDKGSENISIRIMDKALGAVVATGLAFLTLLLVFAIIKAAVPDGSKVAMFFEKAKFAGTLYLKNPMLGILSKILG